MKSPEKFESKNEAQPEKIDLTKEKQNQFFSKLSLFLTGHATLNEALLIGGIFKQDDGSGAKEMEQLYKDVKDILKLIDDYTDQTKVKPEQFRSFYSKLQQEGYKFPGCPKKPHKKSPNKSDIQLERNTYYREFLEQKKENLLANLIINKIFTYEQARSDKISFKNTKEFNLNARERVRKNAIKLMSKASVLPAEAESYPEKYMHIVPDGIIDEFLKLRLGLCRQILAKTSLEVTDVNSANELLNVIEQIYLQTLENNEHSYRKSVDTDEIKAYYELSISSDSILASFITFINTLVNAEKEIFAPEQKEMREKTAQANGGKFNPEQQKLWQKTINAFKTAIKENKNIDEIYDYSLKNYVNRCAEYGKFLCDHEFNSTRKEVVTTGKGRANITIFEKAIEYFDKALHKDSHHHLDNGRYYLLTPDQRIEMIEISKNLCKLLTNSDRDKYKHIHEANTKHWKESENLFKENNSLTCHENKNIDGLKKKIILTRCKYSTTTSNEFDLYNKVENIYSTQIENKPYKKLFARDIIDARFGKLVFIEDIKNPSIPKRYESKKDQALVKNMNMSMEMQLCNQLAELFYEDDNYKQLDCAKFSKITHIMIDCFNHFNSRKANTPNNIEQYKNLPNNILKLSIAAEKRGIQAGHINGIATSISQIKDLAKQFNKNISKPNFYDEEKELKEQIIKSDKAWRELEQELINEDKKYDKQSLKISNKHNELKDIIIEDTESKNKSYTQKEKKEESANDNIQIRKTEYEQKFDKAQEQVINGKFDKALEIFDELSRQEEQRDILFKLKLEIATADCHYAQGSHKIGPALKKADVNDLNIAIKSFRSSKTHINAAKKLLESQNSEQRQNLGANYEILEQNCKIIDHCHQRKLDLSLEHLENKYSISSRERDYIKEKMGNLWYKHKGEISKKAKRHIGLSECLETLQTFNTQMKRNMQNEIEIVESNEIPDKTLDEASSCKIPNKSRRKKNKKRRG